MNVIKQPWIGAARRREFGRPSRKERRVPSPQRFKFPPEGREPRSEAGERTNEREDRSSNDGGQ